MKSIKRGIAVLLAALCNFMGVLCVTSVNASVAETVYSIASFGGGPGAALTALCAAMTAIVLWAGAAWCFGIPTSESHALVAGISGAAVALEGSLSCIRWDCWAKVGLGLILSAAAGFWVGRLVYIRILPVKVSPNTLRAAQLPGAAAAAFLHGFFQIPCGQSFDMLHVKNPPLLIPSRPPQEAQNRFLRPEPRNFL